MFKYKEREDLDNRFSAVDATIEQWRERVARVSSSLRKEFRERLWISLIYHDAALEGDVLSYSEIKAATDPTIISDSTLIPSYEQIKSYHAACRFIQETAAAKRGPFDLPMLRELYSILSPEDKDPKQAYRKENPLHRLYYHDIVAPEQIDDEMEGLGEWLVSQEARQLHVIELVAETHFRLMAIFPWAKQSGRAARLASNLLLSQADYPMAVLHSIDRQAYYEALREDPRSLLPLYIEAIETTALSEVRVYDEADGTLRAS